MSRSNRSSSSSVPPAAPPALTSRHVLQWVMSNTVAQALQGVSEYAKKGMHFAASQAKGGGEPLLQDEVLDLAALYQPAKEERAVAAEVQQLAQQQLQRWGAGGVGGWGGQGARRSWCRAASGTASSRRWRWCA